MNKLTKSIFIDRDGVINEDVGFAHKNHELVFIPRSLQALKLLAASDYKIFIVTNQPVIGRGMCSEEEYLEFEKYLLKQIKDAGGRIDKCYYCPHHPTAGKGKYLLDCSCRKPKPGLLLQAKKEFNIDMQHSFMIGDKRSDIAAGKAAGCKTILVKTGHAGEGGNTEQKITPDYIVDDLYAAIHKITL
ncbi:D-glycero-beta-D-manno-heptose 1,7-bisphosphate 7-phosphatase [Candidatus Woesearchaeota archaeon]|nr:D-glycero-beta-D-manno-heptose 1,7-bisphosphate 7-phosphatase [Candidatus Woesearchaeota archaeon]